MAKNMICSNLNANHSCNIQSSFSTSTINNDHDDYVNKSFLFSY